jgi:hypothetical protein
MKTSGEADPPEIWVVNCALLVSVLVGAETRFTLIFGYTFSKAEIRFALISAAPAPRGLDHQVIVCGPLDAAVVPDDDDELEAEEPQAARMKDEVASATAYLPPRRRHVRTFGSTRSLFI